MKTRDVTIPTGQRFSVPQGIQRLDTRGTHGWQVRYHGTKYFKDGGSDGSGAAKALDAATKELLSRIATFPAPVVLKRGPSSHKSNDLPPGISGPRVVTRPDSGTRWAVLAVLLPKFGGKPRLKQVYIGTEGTYTLKRYRESLALAKEMRAEAIAAYEADATKAKRKEALAYKKLLKSQR